MAENIIYTPSGKALEYAPMALNIFNGCSFGCTYCYAPLAMHKEREEFHTKQSVRKNLLERLEKDCFALQEAECKERILLCFSCDPYQDIDVELKMTREVIMMLNKYGLNFQVLSKGGTRACRDFDLYRPGDAFASTLSFINEGKSLQYEPGAATPNNRLAALRVAHDMGIETWVSLEPVIEPIETLALIEATHQYTDHYKVGCINYNKELREAVDWKKFRKDAEELLNKLGKSHYLKKELLELCK